MDWDTDIKPCQYQSQKLKRRLDYHFMTAYSCRNPVWWLPSVCVIVTFSCDEHVHTAQCNELYSFRIIFEATALNQIIIAAT